MFWGLELKKGYKQLSMGLWRPLSRTAMHNPGTKRKRRSRRPIPEPDQGGEGEDETCEPSQPSQERSETDSWTREEPALGVQEELSLEREHGHVSQTGLEYEGDRRTRSYIFRSLRSQ